MNGHSVNGLPQREATRRALLVVTDGLGYDPAVVRDLARRVIGALDPHSRRSLLDFALEVSPGNYELLDIVRLSVMPIIAEGLSPSLDWRKALETLDKIRTVKRQLDQAGTLQKIDGIRRRLATERRYIPWIAEVPEWSEIVDENLTVPTETSGVWVGYEDVDPPVQGNSETGHQQIGNLALAPQIPLQITRSIEDGSFFDNAKLQVSNRRRVGRWEQRQLLLLVVWDPWLGRPSALGLESLRGVLRVGVQADWCPAGSSSDASHTGWSGCAGSRFARD